MTESFPTAAQLAEAVEGFLREELMPALEGRLHFQTLVAANVMAVVVQYLSAKLGLVTGRSLPELLGDRMPRAGRLLYWAQAEIISAATDLAEVIGGAIALQILFGLPLPLGGNVIRRDLGPQMIRTVSKMLHDSIAHALSHRREAVEYAQQFGRGLDRASTDTFVGMYVNQLTLDYGDRGRAARAPCRVGTASMLARRGRARRRRARSESGCG